MTNLKNKDELKKIMEYFLDMKFPILKRIIINKDSHEIIDINTCEFLLKDLINYINNSEIINKSDIIEFLNNTYPKVIKVSTFFEILDKS